MDFSINQRVLFIRKHLKLSQAVFGERIGVSRDVINNIDNNRVDASTKPLLLQQICKEFNVDSQWLQTGEGNDPFIPMDTEDELMEFAQEINQSRDLEWVKQLVLTVKRLSPEQRAEVSRFVSGLAAAISQNTEKEQDS